VAERSIDNVLGSEAFQAADEDTQRQYLTKKFPGSFGKSNRRIQLNWLRTKAPKEGGPGIIEDVEPGPMQGIVPEPVGGGLPAMKDVRSVAKQTIAQPLYGAAEGLSSTARAGQGLMRELTTGHVEKPPSPEEWSGPVRHPSGPLGPMPGAEPRPTPTMAEVTETLSYPFRKALAFVSREAGAQDSDILNTLEQKTGLAADKLEAFANHYSPAQDPEQQVAGFRGFMRDLLRGTGAAAAIIVALKKWHGGLAKTGGLVGAEKAAGMLTLPTFEYLRAAGTAGEDKFEAAVHGAFIQGGLMGTAKLPSPVLGALASAGVFSFPTFQAAARGEVPWHTAWADAVIWGYFGWHGGINHMRQEAVKQLRARELTQTEAEATMDAVEQLRPKKPAEGEKPKPPAQEPTRPQEPEAEEGKVIPPARCTRKLPNAPQRGSSKPPSVLRT